MYPHSFTQKTHFASRKIQKIYRVTTAVFFLLFLSQVMFYAGFTQPNGPDEGRHFFLTQVYKENPTTIPFEDKHGYAQMLAETQATPYLYHVVMGWLSHLNVFAVDDMTFLRLVNGGSVVFSFSIWCCCIGI